MPSGPKKRKALRRRSSSGPGFIASLDKESVSGSHASDGEGTSPKTSDEVDSRLSVATGTNERPADQTFQTEEWVRVSDFDVGTPTSTTAKSDYDAAAEESYGEVRSHDKLADWETVSRETAGHSSSAEDIGEADHLAAEESSGSGQDQGQKLPHVDEVLSQSSESDKEGDSKSRSSRSDRGESTSSGSSSNRSTGKSPGKLDVEERSSSIVVVPSPGEHEDDSRDSSYEEVASVEAQDDEEHGSIAEPSVPEEEVEKQAAGTVESASLEEQEDKSGSIDDSPVRDSVDGEEHPSYDPEDVTLTEKTNQEENVPNESAVTESEDRRLAEGEEPGSKDLVARELETEMGGEALNLQVPESNISEPESSEARKLEHEVAEETAPELHVDGVDAGSPSEQNIEESESAQEESAPSIEPTTPDKVEEKSHLENPNPFVRSVSEEEMSRSGEASPPEGVISQPVEDTPAFEESSADIQGVVDEASTETHDPSASSGIPEPEQHELDQLLEVAQSKEIADLGRQEEKLLVKEEEEIGKGIAEPQPLTEVLTATDESKPLEGGDLKDLEPVVVEDAPLLKDAPSPVDSGLHIEAELKDRAPELFNKESQEQTAEDRALLTAESALGDSSLQMESESAAVDQMGEKKDQYQKGDTKEEAPFAVDDAQSIQSNGTSTESELGDLVPLISIAKGEVPKSSVDSSKDLQAVSSAISATGSAGSSKNVQHDVTSKAEAQDRPSLGSSELGCCEPVQWLLQQLSHLVSPRAIRN